MKLKQALAGAGVVAAVAAGSIALALPAAAQDETQEDTSDTTTEREVRHRHFGALDTVADILGLDDAEVRDRLAGGESVADIAGEQGVAIDDVVAALLAGAQSQLDDAVTGERLTQDEADERLVEIEERVTAFVNGDAELFGHRGFGVGCGIAVDELADVLGLETADLRSRLAEGATLAEIAADEGVSLADLEAAIEAQITERLEQAVADGAITEEEADERLAGLDERIDEMVNGEFPARGAGFGHGRGFGRRGGPGFGQGAVLDGTTTSDTTDA